MLTEFTILPEAENNLIHIIADIDKEKAQQLLNETGTFHGSFFVKTMLSKAVSKWVNKTKSGSEVYQKLDGHIGIKEICYQTDDFGAIPADKNLIRYMKEEGINFFQGIVIDLDETEENKIPWDDTENLILEGTKPKKIKNVPPQKKEIDYTQLDIELQNITNAALKAISVCENGVKNQEITDYLIVKPDSYEQAINAVRIEVKGENLNCMLPTLTQLALARKFLTKPDNQSYLYIVASPTEQPNITYHIMELTRKNPNDSWSVFACDTEYNKKHDPWLNGTGIKLTLEKIHDFYVSLFKQLLEIE